MLVGSFKRNCICFYKFIVEDTFFYFINSNMFFCVGLDDFDSQGFRELLNIYGNSSSFCLVNLIDDQNHWNSKILDLLEQKKASFQA